MHLVKCNPVSAKRVTDGQCQSIIPSPVKPVSDGKAQILGPDGRASCLSGHGLAGLWGVKIDPSIHPYIHLKKLPSEFKMVSQ